MMRMIKQIIDTENMKEVGRGIEKLVRESRRVVVKGRSIEFNRKILENKKVNMLVLSHTDKKDRLKQRDSGLNEILCKIAKENKIVLAFDLQELSQAKDKKERAELLSRMLQNVKLIKKFRNKFKLLNFKDKEQARAFLLSLGLPTDLAKKAVGKNL